LKVRRIVITGAAGNIGSKLSYAFKDKFDLILLDKKENKDKNIGYADFSKYDINWADHFSNVSTVIHLAVSGRNQLNPDVTTVIGKAIASYPGKAPLP